MQLYMPTMVYSEKNCVSVHGKELSALGTKAMIVTGKHSAVHSGALRDAIQALEAHGREYVLFDRVEENPSIETVMAARAIAVQNGVDFFIGIGGGSPMDAAKAISVMAADPGADATALYSPEKMAYFPVVCIPTTCGTGSEVTPYAILTRHAQRTKKSISHRIYPALALLDAGYLQTLSRTARVNTCVDALAHLLESYLNANSNDLNRVYSRRGLEVWARFRDRLLQDALTDDDHWDMLHASMYAGMAITHTGTSLPHGLSYPVTYELGIPHGRAVGIFLGGFVDSYPNRKEVSEAVQLLGFRDSAAFREYLRQLLRFGQLPQELLKISAEKLLEDPGKLKNYPYEVSVEALMAMLN